MWGYLPRSYALLLQSAVCYFRRDLLYASCRSLWTASGGQWLLGRPRVQV